MEREKPVFPPDFLDPKLPKGVFSHNQYNTFKKCPEAYEREYVRGVRTPTSPTMFKGTVVHGGIEFALRAVMAGEVPALEAGKQKVADLFAEKKAEVHGWEPEEPADRVKDLTVAAYAVWHQKVLIERKVQVEAVEALFLKKVGTVPVMGYIDLIETSAPATSVAPGALVKRTVVDTKTGKQAWSQDDVDRDPQFTLYSLVTGIPFVRVDSLAFLKAGPAYSFKESTRNDHAYRVLVEDYEQVVDLIKRGIFPKAPIDSWGCSEKWCAHWARCRGDSERYA